MAIMTERPLFGGALACKMPESWVDVSDMRQVPDHQECWLDKSTDAMLVVEIVEYQSHVSDEQAVDYFLKDLAEANGCSNCTGNIVESLVPKENLQVQHGLPPTSVVVAGCSVPLTVQIGRESQTNKVSKVIQTDLCAIRLPHVTSEILVTISIPTTPTTNNNTPRATDIASTLQIRDWGLFG